MPWSTRRLSSANATASRVSRNPLRALSAANAGDRSAACKRRLVASTAPREAKGARLSATTRTSAGRRSIILPPRAVLRLGLRAAPLARGRAPPSPWLRLSRTRARRARGGRALLPQRDAFRRFQGGHRRLQGSNARQRAGARAWAAGKPGTGSSKLGRLVFSRARSETRSFVSSRGRRRRVAAVEVAAPAFRAGPRGAPKRATGQSASDAKRPRVGRRRTASAFIRSGRRLRG